MPRRRIIDPQFWNDALIGRLPFEVRLLYIGIWNFSDDAGILPVDPAWLRASIFPHDDLTPARMRAMLGKLEAKGRLLRYSVNGRDYYLVGRFHDHQTIEKPTHSRLPRPPIASLALVSDRSRRNVIARTDEPAANRDESRAQKAPKIGERSPTATRPVPDQSPSPTPRSEVKRSEVNENARAREGGKDDQDADRSRDQGRREGLHHAGGAAVRLAAQLAAGSR